MNELDLDLRVEVGQLFFIPYIDVGLIIFFLSLLFLNSIASLLFSTLNFIGVSTDDENSNCGTLQSLGPIPGSKSFPHQIYLSTTVVACSVYSEMNLIPSSGPTSHIEVQH